MTGYLFPIIIAIDDVLPAIEGRPEFVVADRGDHTIINYNVMMSDTFPPVMAAGEYDLHAAIRRECRGIIFAKSDGKIIRRPLHKFMNVNEKEETLIENLDFDLPHSIYHKLDGSMIAPYIIEGRFIWGTKMAAESFHDDISEWARDKPNYEEFSRTLIHSGYTPIFEWTGPENRIVIGYKETKLTLLAIREMNTGEYQPLKNAS